MDLTWYHFNFENIAQHIERQVQFCANITITVGFLSHIFRVTYYFVFIIEISQQKNTEKKIPSHYFVVLGARF